VAHWSTLYELIAVSVALGWELNHMDVINSFLSGKLRECIYMKQPPGFEVPGKEDMVCLHNRSLYGLKQSPCQWYEEFNTYLRSIGWSKSTLDPTYTFFAKARKSQC
jgi:hypothetical protein